MFFVLFVTYLVVASLIAFFTVKIVGIPIGKKMFTKIVLSIVAFIPVYALVAYAVSKILTRDISKIANHIKNVPFSQDVPKSFIEEVDRLSEVIRFQTQRIGSLIEAQRLTLYRLAHDLRTPLTNLRNVLQAIKDRVIPPEDTETYLEKLLKEIDKIETLLEEALQGLKKVSRKSRSQRVMLKAFLEDLTDLWNLRLSDRDVKVILECKEELSLNVSPIDLEEIVNNLIENAVKHSNTRTVKVRVSVKDRQVLVEVEDEGGNVKGADLMKAYEKGSLGLYIVRELVWRNGGDFKIESREKSTTAVVSFPLI